MREPLQKSFCKSLYHGDILENVIFPYPEMKADENQSVRMINASLEKLKGLFDPVKMDKEAKFPEGLLTKLGEMGLMGLAIPESYGGLGLSNTGYARVVEEIAQVDSTIAVTLGGHQSIGFKALTLFGTKAQKERYYPRLATGELFACFALTEPGAGSDANSIKSKAVLSSDGKHFILNGQKIWITNAGFASFMTVFAKTDEPTAEGGMKEKVTAFLLELPAEGITVGPPEDKMGLRASWTGPLYFENVKIPVENVLGERGQGFKVAMEVLNNGRMGLASGSVGTCKSLIKMAIDHANQRQQFKRKIGEFGMIQEKISQMVVDTFVAESMVYMTTAMVDRKEFDASLESAIVKVFSTETLWRVVNETLQIYGGMGYMKECPLERYMRDVRSNMIFEGTNEILRLFISLSGLQGPGQELSEVAKAIKEPLKQIGVLKGYAAKTIKLNVLGASLSLSHPLLKRQAGVFEDYVAEFALQCAKLLQRHGKSIADRQYACKRVADIAIDLYSMACLLSRVTAILNSKPADQCEEELAIVASFFTRANRRIRGNFKSIDRNDDDENKLLANRHYGLGRYHWDILNSTN